MTPRDFKALLSKAWPLDWQHLDGEMTATLSAPTGLDAINVRVSRTLTGPMLCDVHHGGDHFVLREAASETPDGWREMIASARADVAKRVRAWVDKVEPGQTLTPESAMGDGVSPRDPSRRGDGIVIADEVTKWANERLGAARDAIGASLTPEWTVGDGASRWDVPDTLLDLAGREWAPKTPATYSADRLPMVGQVVQHSLSSDIHIVLDVDASLGMAEVISMGAYPDAQLTDLTPHPNYPDLRRLTAEHAEMTQRLRRVDEIAAALDMPAGTDPAILAIRVRKVTS